MQNENVIEVQNLVKSFKVYYDKGSSLREKILFRNRNRYEIKQVLKGISFSVKKGEAIGLIGKNGCGKSTTLKMLTRIMYPNSGTIDMKGRVVSLIELGAGFHPDMSGRENIYINASIFGIKKKEVDERLARIIRFSELEEFIDNPVRTYSSGMYMRLAFSVAINVDADILLIDEILAVGDNAFQKKCFEKLKEIKAEGTTIVIVSHALGQIETICDRCIWIENGLIRENGDPRKVCNDYLDVMDESRRERAKIEAMAILEEEKRKKEELKRQEEERKAQKRAEELERQKRASEEEKRKKQDLMNATCWDISTQCCADAHRAGNQKIQFTNVLLKNNEEKLSTDFSYLDDIIVDIEYQAQLLEEEINFVIGVTRADYVFEFGCSAKYYIEKIKSKQKGKVRIIIKGNSFGDGKYFLDLRLTDLKDTSIEYDALFSLIEFNVSVPKKYGVGAVSLKTQWELLD